MRRRILEFLWMHRDMEWNGSEGYEELESYVERTPIIRLLARCWQERRS